MKPTMNENEMSPNADVMDLTMLTILLLYNYYYTSTLHPTIIIRHEQVFRNVGNEITKSKPIKEHCY